MYLRMNEDSIGEGVRSRAICGMLWTLSRSTLALLVARIFGANNIHTALPTHYVAAVAHDLDGRPNFHASTKGYWGWWVDMVEMVG